MKWALTIIAILCFSVSLYGQEKYQNWCQQGGEAVVTQGLNSTTRVQRSFPTCTITVFISGVNPPTHAVIWSDLNKTPLGNPFQNQNTQTGQYFFYADPANHYDIQIASPGLTTYTLTYVNIGGAGSGGGGNALSCGLQCAYPQQYGAKADGIRVGGPLIGTGCTGIVGSAVITCTGTAFTPADAGKAFDLNHAGVPGCGPGVWGVPTLINCNLVGIIMAVNNPTSITLSTPVLSAVTNEQFSYASDDSAAIAMALADPTIRVVNFSGTYGVTNRDGVFVTATNKTLRGGSLGRILRIGPVAYDGLADAALTIDNGSGNVTIQDLQFLGTNASGELTTANAGGRQGLSHDGLFICSGVPNDNPTGAARTCNGNSGINDIRIVDCDFENMWGTGLNLPSGTRVTQVNVSNSRAIFNSWYGFNLNPVAGLIVTGVTANSNGKVGLEMENLPADIDSLTVTGSQFRANRYVGLALNTQGLITMPHQSTCQISGNNMSDNGNHYAAGAQGIGMSYYDGPQNCTITGNTFRRNDLFGIRLGNVGMPMIDTQATERNVTLVGNVFSSNGMNPPTLPPTNSGTGILASPRNALITSNIVVDEASNLVQSSQRVSNVVTITTPTAHNYTVGWSVYIDNTPNGVFDGIFTVTGVPAANIFTFAQTGADISPPTTGFQGRVWSPNLGFTQDTGMSIWGAYNSQITWNEVRAHHYFNYAFAPPGGYQGTPSPDVKYFHSLFATAVNTMTTTFPPTVGSPQGWGDVAMNVTPSTDGLQVQQPDIQSVTTACTTAATAGATCVTMVDNQAVMNPQSIVCSLNEGPTAQTGHPIILNITPPNPSITSIFPVTIGTFDGAAAGGGTLTCWTNVKY